MISNSLFSKTYARYTLNFHRMSILIFYFAKYQWPTKEQTPSTSNTLLPVIIFVIRITFGAYFTGKLDAG